MSCCDCLFVWIVLVVIVVILIAFIVWTAYHYEGQCEGDEPDCKTEASWHSKSRWAVGNKLTDFIGQDSHDMGQSGV